MNDRRLRIYLDDHAAMMVAELELTRRCLRNNQGTPLGPLLQSLENDLGQQQSIVSQVIDRIGGTATIESQVKRSAGWFAEKLGRFKLNDSLLTYSNLSRVVELETLAVAAQERVALWDSLDSIASDDARLQGFEFSILRDQAQQNLVDLNRQRRNAATVAFRSD